MSIKKSPQVLMIKKTRRLKSFSLSQNGEFQIRTELGQRKIKTSNMNSNSNDPQQGPSTATCAMATYLSQLTL
jgi:hypothetical protein